MTLWFLLSREEEDDGNEVRKFPIVEEVRELKHTNAAMLLRVNRNPNFTEICQKSALTLISYATRST